VDRVVDRARLVVSAAVALVLVDAAGSHRSLRLLSAKVALKRHLVAPLVAAVAGLVVVVTAAIERWIAYLH
jgi:hypothetical protein